MDATFRLARALKGWAGARGGARAAGVAAAVAFALGAAACQGPIGALRDDRGGDGAAGGDGARITEIRGYARPTSIGADALIERHRLLGADVGYVLLDLESGNRLAGRNEQSLFIPASTAKIPAIVAALHILGPGHRFKTRLLAAGELKDGILKGDLYLKGGGDPLLQPQDLMGLAGRLRDLGVKRVAGRFHYDQSLLKTAPRIEPAQPDNARYNPGISALSLDFNQTLLSWRPAGKTGGTEAFLTPDVGGPRPGLDPRPRPGRNVTAAGKPGAWLLSPAAPVEGSEFLPVQRPGLRTARVFRRLARMAGVDLPPPDEAEAPETARPLARILSLPLVDAVRLALEHSNNLVTELIGLVAARRLTGKALSLADSSRALGRWLTGRLAGVSWDGFHLTNHSGLTSRARVSPEQMAAIVRFAAHQRYGGWTFPSLLPASGVRDSMRGRFRDPVTALRLWAKTGTLKYAKGLTGVLFAQSGRRVAFALYVTDFERRRQYDAEPEPQAPETARRADDWVSRAEALEEDLVREWVLKF